MKKILIGSICLLGLVIAINVSGSDLAVQDRPEITSIKPIYNLN